MGINITLAFINYGGYIMAGNHGTPLRSVRAVLLLVAVYTLTGVGARAGRNPRDHKIHDMERPHPRKVEAAPTRTAPPSDAIVLFGGKDLSEWEAADGGDLTWKVDDGNMVVEPGDGNIRTKRRFGDCQLHLEWATADQPRDSKYPGNSGVYFGPYEVQVLSNPGKEPAIYADGMAGAIYGQYPPLVNACREPGKWQSYDIIYRRPRFDDEGNVVKPATMTILHNGVLVQDSEPLTGPTTHGRRPPYKPHGEVPITLQEHGFVLRFRNVWVRSLDESKR